jgi:hypothetical protein
LGADFFPLSFQTLKSGGENFGAQCVLRHIELRLQGILPYTDRGPGRPRPGGVPATTTASASNIPYAPEQPGPCGPSHEV